MKESDALNISNLIKNRQPHKYLTLPGLQQFSAKVVDFLRCVSKLSSFVGAALRQQVGIVRRIQLKRSIYVRLFNVQPKEEVDKVVCLDTGETGQERGSGGDPCGSRPRSSRSAEAESVLIFPNFLFSQVIDMLITENYQDVRTTADGQGTMRR